MCVREALSWVKNQGFHLVCFETDAKYVVDAIHWEQQDYSKYGSLIYECKSLLKNDVSFSIHFVRRQANEIAHTLAKLSCSLASPALWREPPIDVLNLLEDVCFEHQ
ncbi:hypothetical protein PTKIN_Ptkin15bG0065400 [Pterospermum kingtungense]